MGMQKNFILKEDCIERQQVFGFWLHTAKIEGLGNAGKEKLVSRFGTPEAVFGTTKEDLKDVLGREQAESLLAARKQDVFKAYREMTEQGICFYPFYHPMYPKRLYRIPDRPFGIYVKGKLPGEQKRCIAIIGARDCSEYGRYAAEQFAAALAKNGVAIISGMARGIDGIAQQSALKAGGDSFAVLGCSAEICYPSSHAKLYESLCMQGGILSEYPPGTKPLPGRFPPRNRIISGLSDAVLVIEARKKSGTLITVDMALEQGKEVYVVPGRITDRLSDGCNGLIKQGASVALSARQLIEELSETVWSGENAGNDREMYTEAKGAADGVLHDGKGLSKEEQELLSLLDFYPVSLDQIRIMMQTKETLCGLTLPRTMEMLVMLVLKGFVKNEGGYYALCAPIPVHQFR